QAHAIGEQGFLGAGQCPGGDRRGGGRLDDRLLRGEGHRSRQEQRRGEAAGGHRASSGETISVRAVPGLSQVPATRRRSSSVTASTRSTSVLTASGSP